MENLMFSLNATIPVFLIMVIGYILKNLKMVDAPFVDTLNKLNYRITLPVLLFRDIAASNFHDVWDTKYVLYCFLATLVSILAIWGLTCLFCKDKRILGEFIQASYRSSAAVLGIAFIQNIYGDSGMAPLMIIGTVPLYNVAAVILLSFTDPTLTKEKGSKINRSLLKKTFLNVLTNPIIIGILLGMIVSASGITFVPIVNKTISSLAVLATPLALLALGAGFEGKKALTKIQPTIICSLIKLAILPALFLPIAIYLGFTQEKLVALLIMLGSPTTVSCYIMAKNMHHEGTLTSSVVVTTTFLSSITLTFWLFLLKSMGLI